MKYAPGGLEVKWQVDIKQNSVWVCVCVYPGVYVVESMCLFRD